MRQGRSTPVLDTGETNAKREHGRAGKLWAPELVQAFANDAASARNLASSHSDLGSVQPERNEIEGPSFGATSARTLGLDLQPRRSRSKVSCCGDSMSHRSSIDRFRIHFAGEGHPVARRVGLVVADAWRAGLVVSLEQTAEPQLDKEMCTVKTTLLAVLTIWSALAIGCGAGGPVDDTGAAQESASELSGEETESLESSIVPMATDCTCRSTRTDGKFKWCWYKTSTNGAAYVKNCDTKYSTAYIVTRTAGGGNFACCIAKSSRKNVDQAVDVSSVRQASSPVCYNPGSCWSL